MHNYRPVSLQKTLLIYLAGLSFVFLVDATFDFLFFDTSPTFLSSLLPPAYHEYFMRLTIGLISVSFVLLVLLFTQKERRNARYEAHLFHISPVGIFQSNPEGQLTYVNSRWTQIMGHDAADSLGAGWLDHVFPDDQEQVKTLWAKTVAEKRPFMAEFRLIRPNQQAYWVCCKAEPHFDGKIQLGYLGFLSDIDALKSKEQSLELTTYKLQTALNAKTEFLRIMEHEFRSPLNGIYGSVQVLKDLSPSPEQIKFFDLLEKSTLSLSKVFTDIVAYQRLRDNRIQPEWEDIKPEAMVNDLLQVYQPLAEQKSIQLEFEHPPNLTTLQSDSVLLELVLVSLLSNAIKFTEKGKILVKITDWAENNRLFTRFLVEDTGIGIAQDKVKEMMGPFSQMDQSTSRSYEGLGLGLSIVEHSLKALGSKLNVSGSLGEGTSCSFDIQHVGLTP